MQRSNPTSPNRENKSLEIKSADAFRRFYRLVKALGFVLKEKNMYMSDTRISKNKRNYNVFKSG